jgi:hypothetical protein
LLEPLERFAEMARTERMNRTVKDATTKVFDHRNLQAL